MLALLISSLSVFENILCVPERTCIFKFDEIFNLCVLAQANCVFQICNCFTKIYILTNFLPTLITKGNMFFF